MVHWIIMWPFKLINIISSQVQKEGSEKRNDGVWGIGGRGCEVPGSTHQLPARHCGRGCHPRSEQTLEENTRMLKKLKIFCSMKRLSPVLDHKGWKSDGADERANLIKGVLIRAKKKWGGGRERIRVVNWLETSPFVITNT